MEYRACLRCGSLDLAMPGALDGVAVEGGAMLSWVCRQCGLQSAPVTFPDRAQYEQFRAQRQALFRPGPAPWEPAPQAEAPYEPAAKRRSPMMRGIAAVIGFVFVLASVLAVLTAFQVGGNAWVFLLPSAVVALLFGVPFVAMAARG